MKMALEKYPLLVVLFTQLIVLFFLRNLFFFLKFPVSIWTFVFLQAALCSAFSYFVFKLPRWFLFISVLLPVFFVLAFNYLHFSAWLYGAAFLILALSFSNTLKERVPLYLTNHTTYSALAKLIKERGLLRVVDLGSGLGGVVRALHSPQTESVGVESAPLIWLSSSILSRVTGKGKIFRQSIWKTDLSQFDLVYAFLSPAIMKELYLKVQKEMRPKTFFISNSFPVPDLTPDEVWSLDDGRNTQLYIYEIK